MTTFNLSQSGSGTFPPLYIELPSSSQEGIEQDVPLAAGFEDHIHKAPLKAKAAILQHHKVAEILQM